VSDLIVADYYNYLCQAWNFTPTDRVCSGYEAYLPRLRELGKGAWIAADEIGKQEIQQEVFEIYRKVGIVPIHYYNLDGCRDEILELATKSKNVENKTIGVGNNEALAFGRFWFENMQDAHTRNDFEVSLRGRFLNDVKLKRAIKICYEHRDEGADAVIPKNLRRAFDLVSGGSIQNFKPMNARAVWEYICPVFKGRVLDFSSGYGGRMLGAMTSKMRYHYTGIDPNTKTYNGLTALGTLINATLDTEFEMNCMGSEDFDPVAGDYDAAFSSPPYFNLETYTDEPTQCMNRYSDIDRWFEGYVEPTLKMVHKALDNDAIYAVNIADYKMGKEQFQIVERWKELSQKVGFKYQDTVHMLLNVRPGVGNGKSEQAFKSEGIYIFKKC